MCFLVARKYLQQQNASKLHGNSTAHLGNPNPSSKSNVEKMRTVMSPGADGCQRFCWEPPSQILSK